MLLQKNLSVAWIGDSIPRENKPRNCSVAQNFGHTIPKEGLAEAPPQRR
jgi:hypothetical protein